MPRIIVDLSLASRLALAICYVAMLMQGFCLMLLVMTYNYPILLMLCGGLSVGHLVLSFVGLPKLPNQYKQIAGSGSYLPEADNCCNKIESNCSSCPMERNASYAALQTLDAGYTHGALQTLDSGTTY